MPYQLPPQPPSTHSPKKPKVPVNQLGKYIVASPLGRESILRGLRFDKPYKGAMRYSRVRKCLVDYFGSHFGENEFLKGWMRDLGPNPFGSRTENEHRASCRAALASFIDSEFASLDLKVHCPSFLPGETFATEYIDIQGVAISMRPDVVIRASKLDGQEVTGLIKFHFGKMTALQKEAASYVATLLHQYAEEKYGSKQMATPIDLCIVMDVRHGQIYNAPQAFTQRRKIIAAACREISVRWDSI